MASSGATLDGTEKSAVPSISWSISERYERPMASWSFGCTCMPRIQPMPVSSPSTSMPPSFFCGPYGAVTGLGVTHSATLMAQMLEPKSIALDSVASARSYTRPKPKETSLPKSNEAERVRSTVFRSDSSGGVAADPAGVVFGLQAERRADHGADGHARVAHREDRGHRRDRGGFAGVAAVAAAERCCSGLPAAAKPPPVKSALRSTRVTSACSVFCLNVDIAAGLLATTAASPAADAACERAAHRLDAVFLQLEARRMRLAERKRAGDSQRDAEMRVMLWT